MGTVQDDLYRIRTLKGNTNNEKISIKKKSLLCLDLKGFGKFKKRNRSL